MAPTNKKKSPPKSGKKPSRSLLWRWRRGLFLVALLVVASFAGAGFVLGQVDLPSEDPLLQSTFICASDVQTECGPENAIANLAGEQDRVSLPIAEIPQTLIDAVLAAEDRNFFTHPGIDPFGIARALYRDLRNEGVQQGGSTITQQYVKNAYLTSERTLTRKLKEAVLAVKLERELSKEDILQRYLNTVYFGRGAYGVEAASRAYFDHPVRTITLPEAAYLAALIRSPETADASRDPETATFRRDGVLAGMLDEDLITRAEHDAAVEVPILDMVSERTVREGLGDVVGREVGSEYFVEFVRLLLTERYGGDVVRGGGLRVYTTLDLELQRHAYEAVTGLLDDPATDPDAALVSIDDRGHVIALMGGRDFAVSEFNLAVAPGANGVELGGTGRQPGSSFKPLVLAEAFNEGLSIYSKFDAEGTMIFPKANNGDDWTVRNYGRDDQGIIDLIEATRTSSNTAYAQLMLEVGPGNVVDFAEKAGIQTPLPEVNSLVLGAGEVSPLDMTSAYATFMRRGLAVEPVFITRVEQVVDGRVVTLEDNRTPRSEQVMVQEYADLTTFALRQVVLSGTGTGGNPGYVVAGKTGTTQDNRDAWFVGYSPRVATAVWMGFAEPNDDGSPRLMKNVRGRDSVTGGSFPATIWRSYMRAAFPDGHGSFVAPTTFGDRIFNADLTTTTTTLPPCGPEPEDASSPSTEPCRRTTTTSTEPPSTVATTTPSTVAPTSSSSSTSTTAPSSSSSSSSTSSTSSTSSSSTTSTTAPSGDFDIGD